MKRTAVVAAWFIARVATLWAADTVEHPFLGVTHIIRTETAPRSLHIHIVKIELAAPGIRFKLTPPGGQLETVRADHARFSQAGTRPDRHQRPLLHAVSVLQSGRITGGIRGV